MPSNWLYIDTNFPSFTQKESDGEKIEAMQDYLFMLVEQLRYTLRNLDLKNMNKAAADGFVKTITQPIYAEIKNAEGSITQLGVTADGLAARISSAEGNITQLGVTADGLAARISDAEGNITQLGATADGLSARISSNEGSITNLTADVNGLRTQVRGKIDGSEAQTLISQNLEKITLGATSGANGTIFTISKDGAQIASTGTVDLHVKAVNVDGTLTARALQGGTVAMMDDSGNTIGGMTLAETSTNTGIGITTVFGGVKIQPAGNIFLQAMGYNGPKVTIGKDDGSSQPVIGLNAGFLVLSGSYMFGNTLPNNAPYGTLFFTPE